MSVGLSYFALIRALSNGSEEGIGKAVSPGRSGYAGAFDFRLTWVPVVWEMWLLGLSQGTVPYSPHPSAIVPVIRSTVCEPGEIFYEQKESNR